LERHWHSHRLRGNRAVPVGTEAPVADERNLLIA
jgi:hypothetical protein